MPTDKYLEKRSVNKTPKPPGGKSDEIEPAGRKKPFPDKLEPMLATLVREPFTDADWLYEVKFDGFRILAYCRDGNITLRSRKLNQTKKFPLLVEELAGIGREFIMDGEVVALDENGLPDFDALQRNATEALHLKYYAFDLLYLNGYDLTGLPLDERRALLQQLLPDSQVLAYSHDFEDGRALFEAVKAKGMEGIMAKRRDSSYAAGKRSSNWLKIPTKKVQEFVIGAWTESESVQAFRSMIFGNYVNGKLQYVGHVGHGFKEEERRQILAKLESLQIKKNPFSGKVDTQTKVHWVKPQLVASIEFSTWTTAGNIRKPAVFKGWRDDKYPKEVVPENPLSSKEKQVIPNSVLSDVTLSSPSRSSIGRVEGRPPVPTNEATEKPKSAEVSAPYLNTDSNWRDLDRLPVDDPRDLPVDGHIVKVNNLDKLLWEDEQVTKAALMSYYASMTDYILPYLKDRPLSLYLKHVAPTASGLYIKDMEGRQPDFAEVFPTERKHKKKGKRDLIEYLICNNAATLLYIINLGAIDLNPWSSRITSPEMPDYMIIDLDPSDGDFKKAIETAQAAKELFDEHKLKTFVKTSGKTGLHILIPCSAFNFAGARSIGSAICDEIQRRLPSITTRERTVSRRGNLLYVDDSQNDFADTIASAYSVRPFHIPTVSTPLDWKEVTAGLDPAAFKIGTIKARVEKKGDLFKDLFSKKWKVANDNKLKRWLQ